MTSTSNSNSNSNLRALLRPLSAGVVALALGGLVGCDADPEALVAELDTELLTDAERSLFV